MTQPPRLSDMSQEDFQRSLMAIRNNQKVLEERVRLRFNEVAPPGPNGRKVIPSDAVMPLIAWLAQTLQVRAEDFGDGYDMFYRFDFNGDGVLDEDEATAMTLCMLKKYLDTHLPGERGVVKVDAPHKNLSPQYEKGAFLKAGGAGSVYRGRDRSKNQDVVIKSFKKANRNVPLDDITREFELMRDLKHPNLARYFDIFQDYSFMYLISEPFNGGDLTHAVQEARSAGVEVTESWISGLMKQVVLAVEFLHGNYVLHCDLKPDNAMITSRDDFRNPHVVVIDFGMASTFNTTSRFGGTPGYMPPEVWDKMLWTPKGDVFSIGMMLFFLITGRNPFQEHCANQEQIRDKTRTLQPEYMLTGVSTNMKDILIKMMAKDFRGRIALPQVLQHPYFAANETRDEQGLSSEAIKQLKQASEASELKRALLTHLASTSNLTQFRELNDLFVQLDKDNDGAITVDEIKDALGGKLGQDDIDKFIRVVMTSNDKVAYEEFMGQLIAMQTATQKELLERLFRELDKGNKGFLHIGDMEKLLNEPSVKGVLGKRSPCQVMQSMDKDADGRISFEEFEKAMENENQYVPANKMELYLGRFVGVGDKLMYFSSTHGNKYIPCQVTIVDSTRNALQIDVKPNYWFMARDDLNKLAIVIESDAITTNAASSSVAMGLARMPRSSDCAGKCGPCLQVFYRRGS